MAEESPPAEQLVALALVQRDQVAAMWLARETVIKKNYIQVGPLDTTDATQSNLAQWQVEGAIWCIRVCQRKKYNKPYSYRLGVMLRVYPSIPHGRWSLPSNLMNTVKEIWSSFVWAWLVANISHCNRWPWRLYWGKLTWHQRRSPGEVSLSMMWQRLKLCVIKGGSVRGTVCGRRGGNSVGS